MTKDSEAIATSVSRRSVLRKSAVAGGAIIIGAGISGSAAANGPKGMGGTGFTTGFNVNQRHLLDWEAFEFVEENGFTLVQAPGCTNGQPKEYQGWDIEEVNGDREANFWLKPNRNVKTGVAVEIRNVRGGCEATVLDENGDVFGDGPRDTYRITFGGA